MTELYVVSTPTSTGGVNEALKWADSPEQAVDIVFEGYPPHGDHTCAVEAATPRKAVAAAVAKIRRRADSAHPRPWWTTWETNGSDYGPTDSWANGILFPTNALTGEPTEEGREVFREATVEAKTETVRHMALWSTGPALAVAAWLETVVENPPHEALEVAYEILSRPAPRTTAA